MEIMYDAFISYSHKDMEWAQWIQKHLESYRIPRNLCPDRPSGSHLRIFRDQTDLAGLELKDTLQKELRASRCLLVLCSPDSAASRWVNDEVAYFLSLTPERPVIPFIIRGEPDSDQAELECYPQVLRSQDDRYRLGANVQEIGRNKAFLKAVSLILDVRFNRLVDREKQRKRRTGLTIGLIAGLASVIAGALIWTNVSITEENRQLAYDIYWAALVSGVRQNGINNKSFPLLVQSAEAGNTSAMIYLADCLIHGIGTTADEEAGFSWYARAAEKGDTTAMVALGNCLLNGTGTEVDEEKAFYWNEQAALAKTPDPNGMMNVAIFLEDGIGTQADPEKAFEWYKKAADLGNELSMFNLARCYRDGTGTEANPELSFHWTLQLAEKGNVVGMYNTGLMYQYGFGVPVNERQAYLWYRKAAETGDADSMVKTGWCTENHFGTENDALEWYLKAAELENEEAIEAVQRLTGTPYEQSSAVTP